MKSYADDDESHILLEFKELLTTSHLAIFCGHNIIEFDTPYIMRRMLALGIPIPKCLDLQGMKPLGNKSY